MIFVTLIPIRRNDGSPVSRPEREEILRELFTKFGGATIDGIVTGHWIDEGRHFQDQSLKVTVACDSGRIAEAMDAVVGIGRRLGQVAMYFEVRDFGVAFLQTKAN